MTTTQIYGTRPRPRTTTEWSHHIRDVVDQMMMDLPEADALHVLTIHRERVDDLCRTLRW
jgi:hypothetical protein